MRYRPRRSRLPRRRLGEPTRRIGLRRPGRGAQVPPGRSASHPGPAPRDRGAPRARPPRTSTRRSRRETAEKLAGDRREAAPTEAQARERARPDHRAEGRDRPRTSLTHPRGDRGDALSQQPRRVRVPSEFQGLEAAKQAELHAAERPGPAARSRSRACIDRFLAPRLDAAAAVPAAGRSDPADRRPRAPRSAVAAAGLRDGGAVRLGASRPSPPGVSETDPTVIPPGRQPRRRRAPFDRRTTSAYAAARRPSEPRDDCGLRAAPARVKPAFPRPARGTLAAGPHRQDQDKDRGEDTYDLAGRPDPHRPRARERHHPARGERLAASRPHRGRGHGVHHRGPRQRQRQLRQRRAAPAEAAAQAPGQRRRQDGPAARPLPHQPAKTETIGAETCSRPAEPALSPVRCARVARRLRRPRRPPVRTRYYRCSRCGFLFAATSTRPPPTRFYRESTRPAIAPTARAAPAALTPASSTSSSRPARGACWTSAAATASSWRSPAPAAWTRAARGLRPTSPPRPGSASGAPVLAGGLPDSRRPGASTS